MSACVVCHDPVQFTDALPFADGGSAHVVCAMEATLKQRPKLTVLLSDGSKYPNEEETDVSDKSQITAMTTATTGVAQAAVHVGDPLGSTSAGTTNATGAGEGISPPPRTVSVVANELDTAKTCLADAQLTVEESRADVQRLTEELRALVGRKPRAKKAKEA